MRVQVYNAMLALLLIVSAGYADAAEREAWCPAEPYDEKFALSTESLRTWLQQAAPGEDLKPRLEALGRRWLEVTGSLEGDAARVGLVAQAIGAFSQLPDARRQSTAWKPAVSPAGVLVPLRQLGGGLVSVTVDCSTFASDTTARSILYFATAVWDLSQEGWDEEARKAAQELRKLYQLHERRLKNGLPMWPQEYWINGLSADKVIGKGRDADNQLAAPSPPGNKQWIFLRPSVSPALRFSGTDNSQMDMALTIEPIGMIRYRGSDSKKWVGGSLLVSITNENGVGYGGLYRHGPYTIGTAYHSKSDDLIMYVSLDLYSLVLGKDKNTASADEFLGALGDYVRDRIAELPTKKQPAQ